MQKEGENVSCSEGDDNRGSDLKTDPVPTLRTRSPLEPMRAGNGKDSAARTASEPRSA
jgi:hypothetical protein